MTTSWIPDNVDNQRCGVSELKAYILFPAADRNPLYQGWMEQLQLPVEIIRDYDTDWIPPDNAGIVITHNHYRWEELSILRSIVQQNRVPVLVLVDGILEYRNSFQHPQVADGSVLHPAIAHKIACIGPSQVRWLESWGNAGKCELVGIPRLDDLQKRPGVSAEPKKDASFRILVASARNPWFDDKQRQLTIDGLRAVKAHLEQVQKREAENSCGRNLTVQYRMSEQLHLELQAPGYVARPGPIRPVLEHVDAVITTPSTLQFEAAAMGLPVAVVDFHNTPSLSPMAWTIYGPSQVAEVVSEMITGEPTKMLAQDYFLNDGLQWAQPATERMKKLVSAMVLQGKQSRELNQPLRFPWQILDSPALPESGAPALDHRRRLFPENPVFANDDIRHLKTELAACIHELRDYPAKYFRQRSANHRLRSYINWLRLLIRNRAATVQELTETIEELKRRLADRSVNRD